MDEATLKDANLTGADLTNIDLDDASLSGATLTDADLDNATLGAADLSAAALGGATLTGADLYAVSSGGITGTPAALPANYSVIAGYLIGPDVGLANASLSGVNLSSADLDGADANYADLSGADLSNANVTDAEFVGTVLTGANLAGTAMTGVNFTYVQSGGITGVPASLPADWQLLSGFLLGPGANLSNADLAGADLSTADLAAANLSGANLTGADFGTASLLNATLAGANLSGALMAGANLSSVHSGSVSGTPASLPPNWLLTNGYLVGPSAYLATADLAGANLASADLASANLTNADLEGANLTGGNLTKGHLSDIDLSGANLSGANLTGARMDYAKLAGTDLTNAILTDVWSGYISGSPAALPANWQLVQGYFIGPGAFLVDAVLPEANLAGSDLAGADLVAAYLDDASLANADLTNADLGDAYLASVNLADANLTGAQFAGANLTDASLDGATVTPANFTDVTWLNTICPDGSNSNKYVAGCFSALNTSKPTASPAVTSGTVGANGWYVSPVTVTWNWTDQGPINASACTESNQTSASGDPVTLTATCTDLAGNIGTASYSVKVDATRPDVRVTGVRQGATYALGDVPQAGCRSSDAISGIATQAHLTVTTVGHHGVGKFTAACAGAVTAAGLNQGSPVSVSYVVEYGFGGFNSPRMNVRLRRSSALDVTFRLTGRGGTPLSSALAAALGHAHAVLVTLGVGPGIKQVTATCRWTSRSKPFQLHAPASAGHQGRPSVRDHSHGERRRWLCREPSRRSAQSRNDPVQLADRARGRAPGYDHQTDALKPSSMTAIFPRHLHT